MNKQNVHKKKNIITDELLNRQSTMRKNRLIKPLKNNNIKIYIYYTKRDFFKVYVI